MKDVNIKDNYYVWNKGDVIWINNFFKTSEFSCQCKNEDCIEQKISIELINRITEMREHVKSPMRIHSAYRCSKHQEHIRNSGVSTVVAKKSTHELGNAVDISVSKLTTPELAKVAEYKFKSIGVANNFIHVDLRDDKIRRWKY